MFGCTQIIRAIIHEADLVGLWQMALFSPSLKLTGHSFKYYAPLLWNNPHPLPRDLSHALSKTLFNSTLEKLVFNCSRPYPEPAELRKPERKAHVPSRVAGTWTFPWTELPVFDLAS
jgi:hypothetical protein